ncbi:hypothetical protein G2W53_032131 [Senna tora]|uniref:Uncharacterized protein n=1 Tax=Senna tora TaxID=362788 RepID=A0A834SYA9_9FABA|nr:hypothetical protein G2W53_032131 [Senna tora]
MGKFTAVSGIPVKAISKELNATIAEVGGGELDVAEVADEGSGDAGHEVVDEVYEDGWSRQPEQQIHLNPRGTLHLLQP